ncbi:MAG: thioredoxin family protein [Akkermansiaceae bacterium]|nr:thioredoxin family protein [Akkermansiaceae bacterium]
MNKIFSLLCYLLFTTHLLNAEYRIWTNSTGATVDADLVKADSENVTLKLRNGKLSTFPQVKLSEADRAFIKSLPPPSTDSPQVTATADRKAKWLTKLEKAQEESKLTGLPILMLFTGTSWCPYCVKLEDAVFSQKAFKNFANEKLVLLLLDFGPGGTAKSKDHETLQSEYGVTGFPTYFLIDASGKKLAKGGYNDKINPEVFAEWVNQASTAK